jgi:hypothetical protein
MSVLLADIQNDPPVVNQYAVKPIGITIENGANKVGSDPALNHCQSLFPN